MTNPRGRPAPLHFEGLTIYQWAVALGLYEGMTTRSIAQELGKTHLAIKSCQRLIEIKWDVRGKYEIILRVFAIMSL